MPHHIRNNPEKYGKFAYSARFGFSIESDLRRFDLAVLDNALGFSEDGRHFRVREANELVDVVGEKLYSLWRPFPDIKVESWIWWQPPYHLRVHRIETPARISTIEGGFAIPWENGSGLEKTIRPNFAAIETGNACSAIVNLGSTIDRRMRIHQAPPNTNLIAPRTVVPQLFADVPAGVTILACGVIAQADGVAVRSALASPPANPDIRTLQALMVNAGG